MTRKKRTTKENLLKNISKSSIGTFSIRFNPSLRYKIELASRMGHRTLSGFIESCIIEVLKNKLWPDCKEGYLVTEFIDQNLWGYEYADRVAKLGIHSQNLLDLKEKLIWKIITESPELWKGPKNQFGLPEKPYLESNLDFMELRKNWETIEKAAGVSLDQP